PAAMPGSTPGMGPSPSTAPPRSSPCARVNGGKVVRHITDMVIYVNIKSPYAHCVPDGFSSSLRGLAGGLERGHLGIVIASIAKQTRALRAPPWIASPRFARLAMTRNLRPKRYPAGPVPPKVTDAQSSGA